MRRSLILSFFAAFLASACDTELPCDGPLAGNATTLKTRDITPALVLSYKSWSAASSPCWSDGVDQLRALDWGAQGLDGNQMTVESCLDACEAQGFSIGGLEYSRECFCGNTIIGNNRPIDDTKCNMPCAANPGELCGGGGALNLYIKSNYAFTTGPASVLDSYNGYQKTQCWTDNSHPRILPNDPATRPDANSMTVQKCIDACAASGYSSSGIEYGRECFCGNVQYPLGQSTPIGECDMPCLGDASQICGGRNRMIVYHKSETSNMKGIIQVTNAATGAALGYISKSPISNALYRYQPNEADALIVTFSIPTGALSGSQLRLTATNSDMSNPILGLVQGRDDANSVIQPGSYHYLYASGVSPTAPGSPPQNGANSYTSATGLTRTIESDVWSVDILSGAVKAQWINPDGSAPTTYSWTQSTALYFGGGPAAFNSRYPSPIIQVTFKFLQRS